MAGDPLAPQPLTPEEEEELKRKQAERLAPAKKPKPKA